MAHISSVVGRYVTVEIDGASYKTFYLEAGEGQPLICQHSGGLHNHQWRHALEDDALTRRYRVIAFDAPRHGKSDPPADQEWWKEEYRLTKDFYLRWMLAVTDALELDQPIFMGQGSSGNLALQLALHHPERFAGVIALEAAAHTPGMYLDWWHHPLTNSAQVCATGVWDQMAPQSPDAERWATWFYYTQGSEVFKGDLYFYSVEHDLRDRLAEIDTSLCKIVMMTAEYDYVTTPEISRETAERIPGAEFIEMRAIGHFPMSENYPVFRRYLERALDLIGTGALTERVPAPGVSAP